MMPDESSGIYSEPFVYTADWYERVYSGGKIDMDACFGCFGEHEERDMACLASVSPSQLDRVLVCGCGGGDNAGMLAWRWGIHNMTLVDWSRLSVALCRRRFPNAKVLQADVSCLPFEDHSFDLITALDLTEHLSEEVYWKFLGEVKRLLMPTFGRAIFLPGMTRRPEHINARTVHQLALDLQSLGFGGLRGNQVWVSARDR